MTETNDENLRRIAMRRVNFRKSLYSYIVLIAFMWIIWWMTTGRTTGFTGYPWPVWVMLGWGVSLIMQYLKAYGGSKKDLTDQEYIKLKREQDTKREI
ncbi:MAG TPA: 2TM domain-containing protein [Segetibacter sp.]|nr:2TM domain-containing protein [Segetibacter sp.]